MSITLNSTHIPCDDPDIFMVSFLFVITEQEGLLLDYRFWQTPIDTLFSIPEIDAILISKMHGNILLVECKSGLKNENINNTIENVEKKFDRINEIFNNGLSENFEKYTNEKVLFIFAKDCDIFQKIVDKINKHNIILWSIRPVETSVGQGYLLAKCPGSKSHKDNELEAKLSNGIVVTEDRFACKPLLSHKLTPKEIAYHLAFPFLQYANEKRGETVPLGKIIRDLKRRTFSVHPSNRFMKAVKDLIILFPDVASLKHSGQLVAFKKRPLYIKEITLYERLDVIKKLNSHEYRALIKLLQDKSIEEFIEIIKSKIKELGINNSTSLDENT